MSRNRVTTSQPLASRRALLVDLENMAYDGSRRLGAPEVADRLQRVLERAGAVDYRLAVAPQQVLDRYGAELALLAIRWGVCPAGLDSADRALVELAVGLVGRGFDEVLVASGDHYFARLAAITRLVVVVPVEVPVARALRDVCCALKVA